MRQCPRNVIQVWCEVIYPGFFRTRMRRVIDLRQALEIQRCVDLGGGNRGVSQQFLHRPQIAATLQHV